MKSAWLIAVLLALTSPLHAQDTVQVRPGAMVCGGWVVPDTTPGTVFRCQVNGPNDMRRVRAVVVVVVVDNVPAPPPPPPPPPPVDTVPPPPPDTVPSGWREVFRDDFETGNLTLATAGYRWGISQAGAGDGQPRVVTAPAHSGTRVLAFTYGGNTDPADDGWSEQRFVFGANLTDVRLSWWQFFPADFTIRDAPGTDNLKWLILWDDVYETYRVLLGLNFDRGSNGFQGITRQGVNGRELGGSSFWRPGLTAGMLGRWIFVELEAGVATGGQANGRLILTVDGQVVIDRRDFPIAGATKNYLKNGYLMGWANAGFSKTTVVYVDDFTVSVR
jgi:hypothetical protein